MPNVRHSIKLNVENVDESQTARESNFSHMLKQDYPDIGYLVA